MATPKKKASILSRNLRREIERKGITEGQFKNLLSKIWEPNATVYTIRVINTWKAVERVLISRWEKNLLSLTKAKYPDWQSRIIDYFENTIETSGPDLDMEAMAQKCGTSLTSARLLMWHMMVEDWPEQYSEPARLFSANIVRSFNQLTELRTKFLDIMAPLVDRNIPKETLMNPLLEAVAAAADKMKDIPDIDTTDNPAMETDTAAPVSDLCN